jgi:hypothetical protein
MWTHVFGNNGQHNGDYAGWTNKNHINYGCLSKIQQSEGAEPLKFFYIWISNSKIGPEK